MKKNLRFLQNLLLSFVLFTGCTFSAFAQDWNQVMKVAASDRLSPTTSADSYGCSVALSGDYAFLGSYGAVHIAKYVNNDWVHIDRLTIPGDVSFGIRMAVSEGYMLVSGSSGAYIYKQDSANPDNWIFLKKINSNLSPVDGTSLSIHGNYAIVGFNYEPYNQSGQAPLIRAGAVYIFEKNAGGSDNWGQIKKITESVPSAYADFGVSVAISDNYALISSSKEVTIYRKDKGAPGNWGPIQRVAGPPVNAQDYNQDRSVAIEGDYAVIGTPYEDLGYEDDAGAAYIFKKDANNPDSWNLLQKIQQPDPYHDSEFGDAVAIEGAFIVVGASYYNQDGAVYVFKKASDGTDKWGTGKSLDAQGTYESSFGSSVAISGDKIIGGAHGESYDYDGYYDVDGSGAVYFFRKDYGGAEAWGPDTVLSRHNYREDPGDQFGYSVAISGDYAVVGTPQDEAMKGGSFPVNSAGAAYVLHNNAGNWKEVKKILPPVRYEGGEFGAVVAMDGDNILISNGAEERDRMPPFGSSYLFSKNQGGTDNWGLVKTFTADIPAEYDGYGKSISIRDNYAIVSAPHDGRYIDPATNYINYHGAVYIFEKNTGGANNWGLFKKITSPDPANGSDFGDLIAFDGNQLLAADRGGRGSLYVFDKDKGGTNQWGLIKKITNLSTAPIEWFNARIALDGNNVLVATVENKFRIFGKDKGGINNWGLVKELSGPYDVRSQASSVLISDEYAVLGVLGAAYIFKKDQGGENQWGYVQTITVASLATYGSFGRSVAIDGNTLMIGAPDDNLDANESHPYSGSGSVYFFKDIPLPTANVRINAGGADFQTYDGNKFIADQYYSSAGRITTVTSQDILNTTDDALYYNARLSPSFNYKIPVVNGSFKVVLHFAELYWGINGRKGLDKRKFHVDIEGSRKLTNYEIFVKAGGSLTAVQETFAVTVTDGILNIDFLSGAADMPAICAIEVLPAEYQTIGAEEDSYVRNGSFADDNYGQDVTMQVKKSPVDGYARNSYLKFSLDNITSAGSAKLRIYGQRSDPNIITVLAYGVTDDSWTENGITWNNAPASSGSVLGKVRINAYSGYYDIDVTSFVQSELAGDQVVSLALKAGQNDRLLIESSENTLNPPQLIIENLLVDNPSIAIRTGEKEELSPELKTEITTSRIFPNPARKKFKIAVSDQHKGKVNVQLTSISGRTFELRSGTRNNASEMDIDISSMQLSPGMYVLKIHSAAASETTKVLITE